VPTTLTDDEYNCSITNTNSEVDLNIQCGKYCKHLTPEQERNTVLECLRDCIQEFMKNMKGKDAEDFDKTFINDLDTQRFTQ